MPLSPGRGACILFYGGRAGATSGCGSPCAWDVSCGMEPQWESTPPSPPSGTSLAGGFSLAAGTARCPRAAFSHGGQFYPKVTGTLPPMPPTKPRRAFSWKPRGAFCGQNSRRSAIAQTRAGVSISWAEPGLGCAGSRPTPHGDWQGGVRFQYDRGCVCGLGRWWPARACPLLWMCPRSLHCRVPAAKWRESGSALCPHVLGCQVFAVPETSCDFNHSLFLQGS